MCTLSVGNPSPLSDVEKGVRHKGLVVWLTGLPGSGKSTVAQIVSVNLRRQGHKCIVLDGDVLRHGLCADLGYSVDDRNENVRRVGEVAKLFCLEGTVVIVALISPIREARDRMRNLFAEGSFFEIYCKCPIEVCQARDPKGLYAQAAMGTIKEFTGVSAQYEAPLKPELVLETAIQSSMESANLIEQLVQRVCEGVFAGVKVDE